MNIWFACEPPLVSSSASSTPSPSKSDAAARLSSIASPPRTPSTMLSFAVIATPGPAASRTARSTRRASRARFSIEPP
jgi:hypothetical protein